MGHLVVVLESILCKIRLTIYFAKGVWTDMTNEQISSDIKEVIEWCDEKGHSDQEIMELIRRMVGAKER